MAHSPAPRPFLASVAEGYMAQFEDISDFCFVFPNRRSGTFFLKHLSDASRQRVILAPEVLGIDAFAERVAGRQTASRIDTVFRLYNIYRKLRGKEGLLAGDEDILDFDRFAPWAETVISDFNETDRYDAPAQALFENVRDYREISSNFLTDDQLDVIERYFGYRPSHSDVEEFWHKVDPGDPTVLKEKFLELWRLLPELYDGLLANLEADGLAMPGTIFKMAMERIEEKGIETTDWKRIVFVGFNSLSTTEVRIMAALRDDESADGSPAAEFVWDATGPVLDPGWTEVGRNALRNPALSAMTRNLRNFPMPQWLLPYLAESTTTELPRIETAASPSNAAQVKIAALKAEEWAQMEGGEEALKNARCAIVLPDENLLLPMILSMPASAGALNITMGFSMRHTSVASFVFHLRRLQTRARRKESEIGFYHEDLRLFMAHPLVQVLVGADCANAVNNEVARKHMRFVSLSWLKEKSAETAKILAPLKRSTLPAETIAYLDSVLAELYVALDRNSDTGGVVSASIEQMQIERYRQALSQLLLCVEAYGVKMHFGSVFRLVDKLLASEKITFEGEPLEGLQVMGLLETRALDFEHVAVLSMNDKVMPRRARPRTFIPDALRRGYGLPLSTQGEDQYAYYFYRLLSRAREVTLIYDARAGEGMRSGGKSRFLLQLSMLHAPGRVHETVYSFRLGSDSHSPRPVKKTDKVMERLEAFKSDDPEKKRNLSASAFHNYCRCQLLFYYKNVMGIHDEVMPGHGIDRITQGTIVHDVLLRLYFPEGKRKKLLKAPIHIQAKELQRVLDTEGLIEGLVREAVNREFFHIPEDGDLHRPLPPSTAMAAERLARQVRRVVAHDLANAPLELWGGEVTRNIRWQAGEAPAINIRYAFDRVDTAAGRLRVADYKTGKPRVTAATLEDVFSSSSNSSHMLQLLLYANWLEDAFSEVRPGRGNEIAMQIISPDYLEREGASTPAIGSGRSKTPILSHSTVKEEFTQGMEEMIKEIFNPDADFLPTCDEKVCKNCTLGSLCGRTG